MDILLQSHRDQAAAERFLRRLLCGQGREPLQIITDKLLSYGAARRTILPGVTHDTRLYANNRAEVSHQISAERTTNAPIQIRSASSALFIAPRGRSDLFCLGRHLLRSTHHRLLRSRSFQVWRTLTAA